EFAGDDRGVTGAPATVGDDRARPLHDRLPVRVGHVGHQDLAGREPAHLLGRLEDLDRTGADLLADRAAFREDRAAPVELDPLYRARGLARLHRLRAGLQDVELPVGAVLAPFDVHRPAVVLLDGERVPGQLLDLGVGQTESGPVGRVD